MFFALKVQVKPVNLILQKALEGIQSRRSLDFDGHVICMDIIFSEMKEK